MVLKFVLTLIVSAFSFSQQARAAAPSCASIFFTEEVPFKIAFLSQINSLQNIKKLREYQNHIKVMESAQDNPLRDPRFGEILRKTMSDIIESHLNKKETLTRDDWVYISSDPNRKKMFEGVLYFQTLIEAPIRLIQHYGQYTSTRGGSADFFHAPTLSQTSKQLFQNIYNGPLKYMLLIPHGIDLPGGLTPTQKIFKKLWRDPSFQPSSAEWKILKDYKADTIFLERRNFLNEHRQWVKIRRMSDYALNAILALSIIEAYNWYENLSAPEALVDANDFLNLSKYQLKPDEVRIYNETVPFPHMAIEIDGLVYSYGQTHMTVKTAREYILAEVLEEGLNPSKNKDKEKSLMQKVFEFTGLDKTERVVQVARLKMSVQQKGILKRYLEMQTGKRYRNHTLALDCATMVVKALKESAQIPIPLAIDPSPSQVMMYLSSLKSLQVKNSSNENLVVDVGQVRVAKSEQKMNHLWRNLYINMMETRIFWSFAHFSAAQRAYLELRYGKEGIQYWDQETLDYFKVWESEIRADFAEKSLTGQLSIFKETLGTKDPTLRVALKAAMDGYFKLEVQQLKEVLNSNNSRFEDIYRANVQLALLQETMQQMYREAGFAD